ncbi:hypothetical protein [Ornithinimicrobium cavernae]|uniref:hypothetical protein n=1 Tax=Ornithinimicrobium cavernae TaxID=2666047 RepID=UPI000D69CDC9|nr:hypothetical protein [Ornithinimicrobium cavernae]
MADMRTDVMLSMMRALWEQVTADLRGVTVAFQGSSAQGSVEARFLYDGEIRAVQADCVSLAEAYCIADFPPEVSVRFRAVEHAARELVPGEHWVFLRWEPEA